VAVVAYGAANLPYVGLVGINVALIPLGNFSEGPVTAYALCIDSILIVIYLHGFAMAGSAVNCLGLVNVRKAPSDGFYRCLFGLECILTPGLCLGGGASRCQEDEHARQNQ
jgi:hypothetical protein